MLDFATNEFELAKPQPDKASLRDHLTVAEKAQRRPIERLHRSCPELLEYLWSWFLELSAARSGNGAGPNPISYAEIAAWGHLTGLRPTSFEVKILRALDIKFLTVMRTKDDDGNRSG